MKGKRKILYVAPAIFLIAGLLSGCALLGWNNYTMRAYNGRVVDLETEEPLAGAVVTAVYFHGHNTIAGGNLYQTDGQETITDENGYFAIPETVVESTHPRGNLLGELNIFKSGYGSLEHGQSRWTCRKYPDRMKCLVPFDEFVVFELPRLTDRKERARNIPGLYRYIPYREQKKLIEEINFERKQIGYNTMYSYPEEDHLSPEDYTATMKKRRKRQHPALN